MRRKWRSTPTSLPSNYLLVVSLIDQTQPEAWAEELLDESLGSASGVQSEGIQVGTWMGMWSSDIW